MSESAGNKIKNNQSQANTQAQAQVATGQLREALAETEDKFRDAQENIEETINREESLDNDDNCEEINFPNWKQRHIQYKDIPDDWWPELSSLEKEIAYRRKGSASYLIYKVNDGKLDFDFIGDYRENTNKTNIVEKVIEIQSNFIQTEDLADLKPLKLWNNTQIKNHGYDIDNLDEIPADKLPVKSTITINSLNNTYVYLPSGNLYALRFLFPERFAGHFTRVYILALLSSFLKEEKSDDRLSDKDLALKLNDELNDVPREHKKYDVYYKPRHITSNIRKNFLKKKLAGNEKDKIQEFIFPKKSKRGEQS